MNHRKDFASMVAFWSKAKAQQDGCIVKAVDAANHDATRPELIAGVQRLAWLMTAKLIRESYVAGFRQGQRQKAVKLTA